MIKQMNEQMNTASTGTGKNKAPAHQQPKVRWTRPIASPARIGPWMAELVTAPNYYARCATTNEERHYYAIGGARSTGNGACLVDIPTCRPPPFPNTVAVHKKFLRQFAQHDYRFVETDDEDNDMDEPDAYWEAVEAAEDPLISREEGFDIVDMSDRLRRSNMETEKELLFPAAGEEFKVLCCSTVMATAVRLMVQDLKVELLVTDEKTARINPGFQGQTAFINGARTSMEGVVEMKTKLHVGADDMATCVLFEKDLNMFVKRVENGDSMGEVIQTTWKALSDKSKAMLDVEIERIGEGDYAKGVSAFVQRLLGKNVLENMPNGFIDELAAYNPESTDDDSEEDDEVPKRRPRDCYERKPHPFIVTSSNDPLVPPRRRPKVGKPYEGNKIDSNLAQQKKK
jgi:hypothetical protein